MIGNGGDFQDGVHWPQVSNHSLQMHGAKEPVRHIGSLILGIGSGIPRRKTLLGNGPEGGRGSGKKATATTTEMQEGLKNTVGTSYFHL